MAWFTITWHESDGNDCTVYDTVVEAPDEDTALSLLGNAMETRMTANGTGFQKDGNHLGYYFDCDCDEDYADTCEGHGGTSLREVTAHVTEDSARQAMSRWHSEWSI